eukprot:gene7416-547_t
MDLAMEYDDKLKKVIMAETAEKEKRAGAEKEKTASICTRNSFGDIPKGALSTMDLAKENDEKLKEVVIAEAVENEKEAASWCTHDSTIDLAMEYDDKLKKVVLAEAAEKEKTAGAEKGKAASYCTRSSFRVVSAGCEFIPMPFRMSMEHTFRPGALSTIDLAKAYDEKVKKVVITEAAEKENKAVS